MKGKKRKEGKTYRTKVAGLVIELPIRKVGKNTYIASNHVVVLGKDSKFTERVGKRMAKKLNEKDFDSLLTAEAKSLPLAHVIARELKLEGALVARKSIKSYMKNPLQVEAESITTAGKQKLVIDETVKEKIKNKEVCLFDDVVTTGGTMRALEKLVKKAGGEVSVKAAVWVEGSNPFHKDVIHLSKLPIFKK